MSGKLLVVDCDESVGGPLQSSPAGPAHSVGVSVDISEESDIINGYSKPSGVLPGHIEIDDISDVRNVQTSGSHICGH